LNIATNIKNTAMNKEANENPFSSKIVNKSDNAPKENERKAKR